MYVCVPMCAYYAQHTIGIHTRGNTGGGGVEGTSEEKKRQTYRQRAITSASRARARECRWWKQTARFVRYTHAHTHNTHTRTRSLSPRIKLFLDDDDADSLTASLPNLYASVLLSLASVHTQIARARRMTLLARARDEERRQDHDKIRTISADRKWNNGRSTVDTRVLSLWWSILRTCMPREMIFTPAFSTHPTWWKTWRATKPEPRLPSSRFSRRRVAR